MKLLGFEARIHLNVRTAKYIYGRISLCRFYAYFSILFWMYLSNCKNLFSSYPPAVPFLDVEE